MFIYRHGVANLEYCSQRNWTTGKEVRLKLMPEAPEYARPVKYGASQMEAFEYVGHPLEMLPRPNNKT